MEGSILLVMTLALLVPEELLAPWAPSLVHMAIQVHKVRLASTAPASWGWLEVLGQKGPLAPPASTVQWGIEASGALQAQVVINRARSASGSRAWTATTESSPHWRHTARH